MTSDDSRLPPGPDGGRWATPFATAGAALLVGGLALPWLVPVPGADSDAPTELYSDHWASGWTIVLGALGDVGGDPRVGVAMLSVLSAPVAAALGFATAVGRSRRVAGFATAFGCLAGLVAFVLAVLALAGASRPETDVGGGLVTTLVGAALVAASGVRRRRDLAGRAAPTLPGCDGGATPPWWDRPSDVERGA